MKSYDDFRTELKSAYPITHWELKLPIAVNLENFDIDIDRLIRNLDNIMQQLFAKKGQAKEISKTAFAPWFTDLFTWDFTGIVRFDTMFNQNWELKLVEVNTKRPDWLLMHDNTYSALLDRENNRNLDLFLQLFDKEDYIFIMYENAWFIDSHFLEYEKVKSRWYRVWIWTFEELTFRDWFAYYQDNKIDVLRFSVSPWRLNWLQIALLKTAKLKYINTPDLASMWDKSLMQWIENEMIMKTSILDEKIKDEIILNKDNYVIKPTNKDEWNWVYIWIDLLQTERENLINENLWKQYLAQEYIQVTPKTTYMYLDWDIKETKVYYDCCPHIYYKNWKMIWCGQILVRYSENRIVNVLKWWGIWYMRQDKYFYNFTNINVSDFLFKALEMRSEYLSK